MTEDEARKIIRLAESLSRSMEDLHAELHSLEREHRYFMDYVRSVTPSLAKEYWPPDGVPPLTIKRPEEE